MPALTDQQRAAIHTRNVSIALSAGAGCGKTFVLTERFLSYLEPAADGTPGDAAELGELVAFTYTDRAAREMRDRIRRKCADRLAAADEGSAPYWLGLLRQLDTARVSTIHAFCASFLRAHAVEAGLDPQFRQLDGPQIDTLRWELVDDVLRARLEARDETTIRLAAKFGLAPLRQRVLAFVNHRDCDDFARFTDETPDQLVARWQQAAVTWRSRLFAEFAMGPECRAVRELLAGHAFANPKLVERAAVVRRLLDALADCERPDEVIKELSEAAKVTVRAPTFANETCTYEEFKSCMQTLREAIKAVGSLELDLTASRQAAEYGLQILSLARDVDAAYRREKKALGVLDYDDLIHETRRLLRSPETAELRRRAARQIRLLLVDESQDAGPPQVDLIDALCDDRPCDGKLFLVGDYKQSIYRFLGARPQLFHDRRAEIPEQGRLPLSLNFRSQPAILAFANALFAEEFGGNYEPLAAHRPQATPGPNVEFLWASPPPPDDESSPPAKWLAADLRGLEADWVARRLAGMIASQTPLVPEETSADGGSLRPLRPGDVAILFRSLSDVEVYETALRNYDLPYYLVGGRAFYSQQEVYDVVNLLRTLISPCDEVSLAGALRGPMFNLCDEALYWLAQHDGGLSAGLFAAKLPAGLDNVSYERARRAAAIITDLRRWKDRMPVAELLGRAIAMTGYDAALLCEFLGERKLANLHKLVEMARAFDRSDVMTLADFVVQLAEFVADQPREALAAIESEAGDVIRLMTIHQAKGLEFPLVVVADCERKPSLERSAAFFDPERGPLVSLPAREYEKSPTIGFTIHRDLAKRDDEEEAIRLLYVAVTRAADYLILSGGLEDIDKPKGHWSQFLAKRFDRQTGRFLNETPTGHSPPEVRVTARMPEPSLRPAKKSRGISLEALADRVEQQAAAAAVKLPDCCLPFPPDPSSRQFFSFSQLKNTLVRQAPYVDEEDDPDAPPRLYSPVDLGTLVHATIERLDWDAKSQVRQDIPRLVQRELDALGSGNKELAATATGLIERLVASPLGREIAAARQRQNEVEFLFAWPPNTFHSSATQRKRPTAGDAPILHGFLDCLFQDPSGRWHVIDYKTNQVRADQVAAAAAVYELQMLLYGVAAEAILAAPPASLRLFFMVPGIEHSFPWNEGQRRRAIELVTTAIDQAKRQPLTA